jgi:hypothetical protein
MTGAFPSGFGSDARLAIGGLENAGIDNPSTRPTDSGRDCFAARRALGAARRFRSQQMTNNTPLSPNLAQMRSIVSLVGKDG